MRRPSERPFLFLVTVWVCCRCGLLTKNIIEMIKIELEEWQVKNLREYFGYNDKTQTEHWAYDVFNKAYNEQCNIPVVVSSKNKPKRTLGDFDVWYKPCTRCGYDTAKSTKPKDGNKTCWKCGNFVQRDFTDRALKK